MEAVAEYFLRLNETHGINFSIFHDSFDRSRFLRACGSLSSCLICIVSSLVIGLLGAWMQRSPSRLLG